MDGDVDLNERFSSYGGLSICDFLDSCSLVVPVVLTLGALYVRGAQVMDSLRLSDAHVKDEEDDDLSGPEETSIPADKARRRQSSPKRRKIEHESNLVFEVHVNPRGFALFSNL